MDLRPELLLHPTLPPPLHGIAPRVILGKKWWDVARKAAAAQYEDCCWSCGTHKAKTWYRKYLEGHESYLIDYNAHTVTLNEVVSLCHSCHNFIHIGRLVKQFKDGIVSSNYVRTVLDWGMATLTRAGYTPPATQAIHWLILEKDWSQERALDYVVESNLETNKFNPDTWDVWKMIVDGQEYSGKSKLEWVEAYG